MMYSLSLVIMLCPFGHKYKKDIRWMSFLMVGRDGFEPSKSVTADLQSAPFGRSGIPPHIGAGRGSRTPMTSLEGWCTAVMPYPHNFLSTTTTTRKFIALHHPWLSLASYYQTHLPLFTILLVATIWIHISASPSGDFFVATFGTDGGT